MGGEEELFLSLITNLRITQIAAQAGTLCVSAVSVQVASCCPLCGQESKQIHSRYRRILADVPCSSQPVSLHLEVRKFVCQVPTCRRKIFTERLPELVQPSARMTNRLRSMLQTIGLAAGGEAGSRLAGKLGMRVTPSTLLRCLRAVPLLAIPPVRVLGLDDWSYKRGKTFGTMLVDLERHRVIDLLPDRQSESVRAWLEKHPEIEIISRDRASGYADAARQGAPQATQVADRFHLVRNVREKLQELLTRKRACLPWKEMKRRDSLHVSLLGGVQSEGTGRKGEIRQRRQKQSPQSLGASLPVDLQRTTSEQRRVNAWTEPEKPPQQRFHTRRL